ncbi:MAG: thioredoxin-like domain-containing protein [Bacteroidota bacterium]
MKKSLLLLVLIFISRTFLIAGNYEIKLTIKGIKNQNIQLAYYFGDKQYIRDSSLADENGKLTFKGDENLPGGVYLAVLPSRKYFEIIVDKEQRFSMDTDTLDLISNMKVKGSKDNEAFYEYLNWISVRGKEMERLKKEFDMSKGDEGKLKLIRDEQNSIDRSVKDYKNIFISNHPEMLLSKIFNASWEPEIPETPILSNGRKDSTFAYRYYKAHYFDKFDLKDDRLLRSPVFGNKIKQYFEKLTPQIPDSINQAAKRVINLTDEKSETFKFLVYWITNTYEKSEIMGMDAVFVYMAKNYYMNGKAYWVEDEQLGKIKERVSALEPCLIGVTANNMHLLKSDFHPIALNDIKKKYTLVYFWDPSCGHCQKVTPKLRDFYITYKKEFDLEVLGVYIEADTSEWFKYIKEKELNWINAADLLGTAQFRKYYDIYSTPVLYVLDRNKKIIAKRIDVEKIEDFLKNYEKFNK